MHLHNEGSIVGVECHLMIYRAHIRASQGAFQIFCGKIDILFKICTFVFISG